MHTQPLQVTPITLPIDPWSVVDMVVSYGLALLAIMIALSLPTVAQVVRERLSGRRW